MKSAIGWSRSSRPLPTTTTWSAVTAISPIRCEDKKTVRPSAASPWSSDRIHRMPSRSSPLMGSSSTRVAGSPRSAAATPSRWPIPSEKAPTRLSRDVGEPDELEDLVDARAADPAGRAASARRWLRAERPGWTARASSSAPTSCSGAACARGRRPLTRTEPLLGWSRPSIMPHRRGLAGTVGTEETGDHSGPHDEREVVDRQLVAVPLGQSACFDHEWVLRGTLVGGTGIGLDAARHLPGCPAPPNASLPTSVDPMPQTAPTRPRTRNGTSRVCRGAAPSYPLTMNT